MPPLIPVILLGLAFGSFAGAAVTRIPAGISLWHPPSHCDACGQRLRPLDMIPVLSWILYRGKCRSCGTPFPPLYPLIETAIAGQFAIAWLATGRAGARFIELPACAGGKPIPFVLLATLCWAATVAATIDAIWWILPDSLTALIASAGLLRIVLSGPSAMIQGAIAAALAAAIPATLLVVHKRLTGRDGMGWGDIKFLAAGGLWLPPHLIPIWWGAAALGHVMIVLFQDFVVSAPAGAGRQFDESGACAPAGGKRKFMTMGAQAPMGPALAASLVLMVLLSTRL